MKETIGFNPESPEKKADLPGINLSSHDLMVLLVASYGNNKEQWTPEHEIQISGNEEHWLPYGWLEMVTQKYQQRIKGKGRGNIILIPKGVDKKLSQLVREVSLRGLIPLIDLYHNNLSAIDSITLLPNTSLGVGSFKHFNGLKINVNKHADKENIKKLMDNLQFPWGRSVLVCKLSGIGVEAFVSNFADGRDLTPVLKPCKFSDFFYDKEGEVYVVIGGGGLKKRAVFDIYGTNKQIKGRLETLYSSAKDELIEKAKILTEKIGPEVGFEVVTAYPYVSYDPESHTVFSGLPVGSNYVLFNPRPHRDLNLDYFLYNGPLIGANPKSPVAKIVGPLKVSGTPLTRVADFGI